MHTVTRVDKMEGYFASRIRIIPEQREETVGSRINRRKRKVGKTILWPINWDRFWYERRCIRGSIGGSRYSRGGARAKGSPCPDFSSRDFSLYRYLRCFPVSCVAETRNISALWIFSSPSAFLETRPARCFVGSPIPRKTRSFRDSRIEKKKELRGNIIGPPFWNLFSFIFFIVTINISVGNGSRCILVNYSSFVADHTIEDRQQPVCEGIPGHGGREAREKVSIAFKISSNVLYLFPITEEFIFLLRQFFQL